MRLKCFVNKQAQKKKMYLGRAGWDFNSGSTLSDLGLAATILGCSALSTPGAAKGSKQDLVPNPARSGGTRALPTSEPGPLGAPTSMLLGAMLQLMVHGPWGSLWLYLLLLLFGLKNFGGNNMLVIHLATGRAEPKGFSRGELGQGSKGAAAASWK